MDKEKALERLTQAVEYLKSKGRARNQEEIAQKMEARQPHISAALKGDKRRLTETFLRKFAKAYAELISEEWLVNGTGQMQTPDPSLRPHFTENTAAAGFSTISMPEFSPQMIREMPWLGNYDFTIQINGDSMEPEFHTGDIVTCRRISDRLNLPVGKVCVFDTSDGPVIKMLRAVSDDSITLHSLNPAYRDFTLAPENVISISLVTGLVRFKLSY